MYHFKVPCHLLYKVLQCETCRKRQNREASQRHCQKHQHNQEALEHLKATVRTLTAHVSARSFENAAGYTKRQRKQKLVHAQPI